MEGTQLAVTTETDFGVDTPVTVGVELEPPVLLPEVPVELVLPEVVELLPLAEEPSPQPTSRMTSAVMDAQCDHVLNDIQHSSYVDDAAQHQARRRDVHHQDGMRAEYKEATFAVSENSLQVESVKCEGWQLLIEKDGEYALAATLLCHLCFVARPT